MWFSAGMLGMAIFALIAVPAEYRPIDGHLRRATISLFSGMAFYCVGYEVTRTAGLWFPGM